MTRSEKKQAAETRRLEMICSWCMTLKNDLHAGKEYKQATMRLAEDVTKLIRQQPQRKAEILQTWGRMRSEIRKHQATWDESKIEEIKQELQNG